MSTATPPPIPPTSGATDVCAASSIASPAPAAGPVVDLSAPLYAIEHLALMFMLEVDSARELTYRTDFPQPIKIGRRWLWFPDEIHAWSREQKRYSTAERKRNAAPTQPAASTPVIKPYKPRAKKSEAA